MAMLATVFEVLETPVRGSLLVLVGGAWLFVVACLAVGFAIVILSGSLRLAASGVALYTGVAFPFIGITFPALAMPPAARAWAEVIPLTHFVRVLVEQGLRGADVADSAARLTALGGFVVAAAIVSAWPFWRLTSGRRAWRVE
jgi:ABC-2 type transport system permease protein